MTNEIITKRLTLIKGLLHLGKEQASLSQTISFTSVLTIHDSIDMFMHLAREKKEIRGNKYLMDNFDLMPELTLKASVNKINQRRNNLKHHGIIPGQIELEETCIVASLFLEENTRIIFNVDFNSVSIYSLIHNEPVRKFLLEADSHVDASDMKRAAVSVAKAYFHLMIWSRSLKKDAKKNPWYDEAPQPMIKEGKFYTKGVEQFFERQDEMFKEPKIENGYVEISEGVAAITYRNNKAMAYLFQTIEALALGFDIRKYNYFMEFMPQVMEFNEKNNEYSIGWRPYTNPKNFTKDQIKFSIEFVTDFAFRLQEFKY